MKKGNLTPSQMEKHADAWLAVHGATPGEKSYQNKNEPKSRYPYVAHVLKVEPTYSKSGKKVPGMYTLLIEDVDDFIVMVKAKSRRDALIAWLSKINFDDDPWGLE